MIFVIANDQTWEVSLVYCGGFYSAKCLVPSDKNNSYIKEEITVQGTTITRSLDKMKNCIENYLKNHQRETK